MESHQPRQRHREGAVRRDRPHAAGLRQSPLLCHALGQQRAGRALEGVAPQVGRALPRGRSPPPLRSRHRLGVARRARARHRRRLSRERPRGQRLQPARRLGLVRQGFRRQPQGRRRAGPGARARAVVRLSRTTRSSRSSPGYMRPGNYEIFRDSMADHGLLDRDHDFAWASGRYQVAVLQGGHRGQPADEGHGRLPAARSARLRRPGHGPGRHPRHLLAEQGLRAAARMAPLLQHHRAPRPAAPARLHDGRSLRRGRRDRPLRGRSPWSTPPPAWRVVDRGRQDRRLGHLARRHDPDREELFRSGKVHVDLASSPRPRPTSSSSASRGTPFENDWNFWVYPRAGAGRGAAGRAGDPLLGRGRSPARRRRQGPPPAPPRRPRLD